MSYYRLTANLGTVLVSSNFEASDDDDATFWAIGKILERAHADRTGPWALGAITLIEVPSGRLLHEMASKGTTG